MLSQGEVIKTWRKRWFVLKDGFLFRFLDDKVTPASKPRGIVDLSRVRPLLRWDWYLSFCVTHLGAKQCHCGRLVCTPQAGIILHVSVDLDTLHCLRLTTG
jgi:hypothetical protein